MDDQTNFEKNPLDELFARRLGKLERPPSPESFARLQQRMTGAQEPRRVLVWWQNTSVQLAAACVAVLLLFGWFYSNQGHTPSATNEGASVADRQPTPDRRPTINGATSGSTIDTSKPTETIAQAQPSTAQIRRKSERAVEHSQSIPDHAIADGRRADRAVAVHDEKSGLAGKSKVVGGQSPSHAPAVAVAPIARPQAGERVLVVTIDEPEALVAARQTAASVVNNMPVLAASPSKEGKATFWQQVKRLKQDDDVARQEGATDESGLLGRAYKGIKQRLEKDKSDKQ